jgi:MSHA biogenesis protein MshQ
VTPNFGNESSAEGIELVASSLVIPASGRYGSSDNGAVGRFYPVAFAFTTSGVSSACNGFTYMNQPALALSYNLEAQGNAGNKLFNYDLVLLGSSRVSSPSLDLENSNQGTNLSSRLTTGTSSWINGRCSYSTLIASFNRAASADGPYTGLAFGVSANDLLDSRLIGGLDTNAATNTDCVSAGNCNSRTLAGSSQIYYGRLEVSNTFGPETDALDITMHTSYFNSAGYVVNSSDNCTGYTNTNAIKLSSWLTRSNSHSTYGS